jgi:hypothetical protein
MATRLAFDFSLHPTEFESYLGSQSKSLNQKPFRPDLTFGLVLFCTNFCSNFLQFGPLCLELPPFLI